MPTTADISVVIPTLNEEENIRNILNDLLKQTMLPKEIIVVDGGSHDDTVSRALAFTQVRVLQDMPQPSKQRNTGWQHAQASLIMFLDADTTCANDFIQNSLNEMQQKKLDTACPEYIPITNDTRVKIFYSFLNILFKAGETFIPSGAGSCIVTKKEILKKTEGFNAAYTYDDIYFLRQASTFCTFGMLHSRIYVSPRRFEQYGVWKTIARYTILSILFLLGAHGLANKISYPFAEYTKTNE